MIDTEYVVQPDASTGPILHTGQCIDLGTQSHQSICLCTTPEQSQQAKQTHTLCYLDTDPASMHYESTFNDCENDALGTQVRPGIVTKYKCLLYYFHCCPSTNQILWAVPYKGQSHKGACHTHF